MLVNAIQGCGPQKPGIHISGGPMWGLRTLTHTQRTLPATIPDWAKIASMRLLLHSCTLLGAPYGSPVLFVLVRCVVFVCVVCCWRLCSSLFVFVRFARVYSLTYVFVFVVRVLHCVTASRSVAGASPRGSNSKGPPHHEKMLFHLFCLILVFYSIIILFFTVFYFFTLYKNDTWTQAAPGAMILCSGGRGGGTVPATISHPNTHQTVKLCAPQYAVKHS